MFDADVMIDALRNKKEALDALIAATALEHGAELVTWNKKHFKPVAGLKLKSGTT